MRLMLPESLMTFITAYTAAMPGMKRGSRYSLPSARLTGLLEKRRYSASRKLSTTLSAMTVRASARVNSRLCSASALVKK